MKTTNFILFIIISALTTFSCKNTIEDYETTDQIHFNIIFAPDLSDRISNKNYLVSDEKIAEVFCSILYPDIINNDAQINQLDRIKFDFINPTHGKLYHLNTTAIDLSVFKNNQLDRVKYLGVFDSNSQFKTDMDSFIYQFTKYNSSITLNNDHGSDIYNYLEHLSYLQVDTTKNSINDDSKRLIINSHYENILVILTDGYIETGERNDNSKKSESLSEAKINNFRNDYLNRDDKNLNLQQYFNVSGYKINEINNTALSNLKIIVLQIYDRGHTEGGNKNPGPSDEDIIKIFWMDWLTKSGVPEKNIKLYSTYQLKDSNDIKNAFKSFLNL